jgi:hypothetical protein
MIITSGIQYIQLVYVQTHMPAAGTQYRTGPTYHHRESCDDYPPKTHTFYTGVNTSPK